MADSVTVLQDVGTSSTRKTLAILGDGFAAGADQTTYNNYVRDEVLPVFESDAFNEDLAAWNIRRVNLESIDSGASTRTWDLKGTPSNLSDDTMTENINDTALNIISNGEWWHGWFENSSNTQSNIDAAVAKWAPGADFILIIVNSALDGGLRSGNVLKVTTLVGAAVIAHEFGHGFGDLADEYSTTDKGDYTGGDPTTEVNVTTETDRTKIKWRQYIAPGTPIPTGVGANAGYTAGTPPAGWDDQDDAGLFEGAHTWETGIYRPALNCRMRENADAFCPPCYSEIKDKYHAATGRRFRTIVAGRFTGSSRSEFFGIDERGVSLYRADGARWRHVRTSAGIIPGGWGIRDGDTYVAGDFDGDGRDELVVYNSTWWTIPLLGLIKVDTDGSLRLVRRYDADIPGWGGFATNDQFLAGDFDGDGRDDLFVTNFTDWVMPYVATLRSTGTGFSLTRRYDGDIPGWGGMREHDEVHVGDFAGTGRADLLLWNSRDWSSEYLGLVRHQRGGLRCIRLWEDDLPGWGGFARNDRIYVGDFNGDGKDDLYLFNGPDWANPYLGMFRSTGSNFTAVQLYDGDVPGWGGLAEHDRFLPADLTGNGRVGLFAWNVEDWDPNYAGRMRSTGNALTADWREDWVGEWHLGVLDNFTVARPALRRLVLDPIAHTTALSRGLGRHWGSLQVEGLDTSSLGLIERLRLVTEGRILVAEGPDRVIAHNRLWLGTFRTSAPLTLDSIYNRWIHNYKHGRNW